MKKTAGYENYNCNNINLLCLTKEKGNTFKLAVIMIEFVEYERFFGKFSEKLLK